MTTNQRLPRLERLMVTRPAAEATRWTKALRELGWPACALPLLAIGEPRSANALSELGRARRDWAQWDALMFVSSAAVTHFFSAGVAPLDPSNRTRFWAPGPGTARTLAASLAALGVSTDRIDAPPADAPQFDSETLWPVVNAQVGPGKRVLIVRGLSRASDDADEPEPVGGSGREWLIRQCERAGADVSICAAYERLAPEWTDESMDAARAGAAPGNVWLLSSSEALRHLRAALPDESWASAAALATHPRIAQAARDAGFGAVQSSRPALPDVVRALESHWSPP